MAYDGSYYHGIPQVQRPKAILLSNLETANLDHYIDALGLFAAFGLSQP